MESHILYYIHNYKVYKLNLLTNEFNKVFEVKEGYINYTFYEFFENYSELILILKEEIILFDKFGFKTYKHSLENTSQLLDIIKHKDKYYFLTKSNIYIFNDDFSMKEYPLKEHINYSSNYQKYVKLLIYNNEIYYTNYTYNEVNEIDTILYLNLVKVDLEKNENTSEILFKSKVLSNNFNNYYIYFIDITIYKNNIIFGYVEENTNLIKYNLDNKSLESININLKIIGIRILDDKLLLSTNTYNYDCKFLLYDIETFKFDDFLHIDIKPTNGYYKINISNNKLIIFINKPSRTKVDGLYIYQREVQKKDIKLGALALKHIFKDKLGIDFGHQRDVKELILQNMKSKTLLDEEDKVIKCEITDFNYFFELEIPIP